MPRPTNPTELLTLPVSGPDWAYEQQDKARFYLTNFDVVFRDCKLTANKVRDYIVPSKTLLKASGWAGIFDQYFDWDNFARTQLDRLTKDGGPYLFEKACRVVLAIEAAAVAAVPNYDIYEYIQIIPAVFVVSEFTPETLGELRRQDPDFDRKALNQMGQRQTREVADNVISQLAKGKRVTLHVARHLIEYVKKHHPKLNIGEVVFRDIDPHLFGNHHSATMLKTPSKLTPDEVASERVELERLSLNSRTNLARPSQNQAR